MRMEWVCWSWVAVVGGYHGKQKEKSTTLLGQDHIYVHAIYQLVRVLSALTSCFSGWSFMVSTNFSDKNTIFSSLPDILSNQYFK